MKSFCLLGCQRLNHPRSDRGCLPRCRSAVTVPCCYASCNNDFIATNSYVPLASIAANTTATIVAAAGYRNSCVCVERFGRLQRSTRHPVEFGETPANGGATMAKTDAARDATAGRGNWQRARVCAFFKYSPGS